MSLAEQPLNVCQNFLTVAEKFDKDRGPLDDTNAFFSCDGYGVKKEPSCDIYNLLIINFVHSFRDGPGELINKIIKVLVSFHYLHQVH